MKAARFEPLPGKGPDRWVLMHGADRLGDVERSPAGNFYAFAGHRPLGLFNDRTLAGEAICHRHGLLVEIIL